MQVLEFKMKRAAQPSDEPLKKRKVVREDSSDEDEESSQRTTSQDSSQSESLSDVEDHKPSFSRPSNSQNAEGKDASSETSSEFAMYNNVSQKLMAKMGFRVGEGLGKYGQGRREIVEASTQRGRRGLGLTLKGFQGDLNVDWQDEPEPSAIESVSWFPESSPEIPDSDELREWMAVGQTVFDDLEGEEMRRARTRSNPYETIRGAFFLNRAAMKMANMDHVFDYMFTNPKDSHGKAQTRDRDGELLYFGDVCAGPGGFSEYVLWRRRWHAKDSTDGRGLHFLMADGGFSVEGQENIQEILSKQLLLVGLIYLLYLCFERVSLFKPVTSRPANSERYVVCKSLKPGTDAVREYMFTINLKLNQFRHSDRDVTEVVPLDIIKGDTDFFQCMINSNESHCAVQIKALAKIHAYVRDTTLFEPRQADIRKECLKLWGIPDKARVTPSSADPKTKFYELVKGSDMDSFSSRPTALNSENLDKLQHVLDYRCIVGGGEQLFLLGLGRSQIYTWDGKTPLRWKKLENFKLELPRETLLSVEIVQELKGEGKAQRRINAVHVLDALVLNGTDVRDQHFNQRIQMAEKFVKAVSKPSRPDMNPIRVKEVYRLEEMEKIFVRLEMKITKSSGGMPRLSYTGRDDRHFLPNGLYIIKTVNDPWTMAFSKSSKRKFFYNKQTKESTYELPPGSVAPFHVCHQDRLFWAWEEGVRVHDSQTRVNPNKLSKDDVLSFIHQHCQQ
ncbi:Cap-specific mRNA (nucleoside-2'-O-)-methyltransferase 1 [Labeo rohita]|uniref:Cap-specific mRNA (nucleoside-2'-O-)-methyltransferase 1 n=1 Tax=Labeo rohita TaxID=84645 RepID=A0ABQ8LIR1_LABRO|nr:Cap-specific mRNA (nucleoside-2'-O-)-methyltransferase 1 [Labeo rohita]